MCTTIEKSKAICKGLFPDQIHEMGEISWALDQTKNLHCRSESSHSDFSGIICMSEGSHLCVAVTVPQPRHSDRSQNHS